MPRNKNASTKLKPPAPPIPRCLNCGEGAITETEQPGMPFGCMACGAWGLTADKVDNPPDDDSFRPAGQVSRKPPSE